MMHDREKVIRVLNECKMKEPNVDFCIQCPYETNPNHICFEFLLSDALALLQEQEAELSYREARSITHTATKLDDATCPSCGNVVGEKIRTGEIGQSVVQVRWDYCRFCGQKLDWEGR